MSVDQKTYELIDAYLKNQLKVEDADKVKYRIRTEPEFAEQVELQKAIIAEIEIAREKELRALLTEKGKVTYISNTWGSTWVRASAAIIIGFVALFFIIKYYMPEEQNPLVERSDDSTQQEVTQPIIEAPEGTKTPTMPVDSVVEVASAPSDTTILESAEEVEADAEQVDEIALADDQAESSDNQIATLREESDKLQVEEDVEVKTDKLIAEKVMQVRVVAQTDVLKTVPGDKETVVAKELSRKEKRKEKKDTQANGASESDDTKTKSPTQTRNLAVEIWESIVNFRGYVWDRETLLLYDIKPDEKLQFIEYNKQLYMKRGSKYYIIRKSSKFEAYTELKDQAILSVIRK